MKYIPTNIYLDIRFKRLCLAKKMPLSLACFWMLLGPKNAANLVAKTRSRLL